MDCDHDMGTIVERIWLSISFNVIEGWMREEKSWSILQPSCLTFIFSGGSSVHRWLYFVLQIYADR